MDTPGCFAAVDLARHSAGFSLSDLRELIVSYFHPGHVGMASHLLRPKPKAFTTCLTISGKAERLAGM